MELKKRENAVERNYAKSTEVSKSDLKKSTPNKWLAASAVGLATLFYANPKSIFGSIGVVFGCVSMAKYTPLGEALNSFSGASSSLSIVFAIVAFLIGAISMIRKIGINKKDEEEKERIKRLSKSEIRLMMIFIVLALLLSAFFLAWELWLSDLPYFIDKTSSGIPNLSVGY